MAYVPKPGEQPKYHCTREGCQQPVYLTNYNAPFGPTMRQNQWCFSCVHWQNLLDKPLANRLIIEGGHYVAKPGIFENYYNSLGMGGRTFTIRSLTNDETFQTNNLWFQGDIPEPWLPHFPNTHEFMDYLKLEIAGTNQWVPIGLE